MKHFCNCFSLELKKAEILSHNSLWIISNFSNWNFSTFVSASFKDIGESGLILDSQIPDEEYVLFIRTFE